MFGSQRSKSVDLILPFQRLGVFLILVSLFTLATGLEAQVVPGHYIVELTESPVAEKRATEPRLRRRRAELERRTAVESQQRILRSTLPRHGATAFASVDTVANALVVRIPDRLAGKLQSLPGVKNVFPVYEIRPLLERAMPLHHVPQAWSRLGGSELAGAGVKIGIIDSGIDVTHPGFVDPSIPMPEGFPRVNRESDLAFTSNKVIVARSYRVLLDETDISARDIHGHGTAVAMAAAGVIRETADGPISGAAPKAYLGSYAITDSEGFTRTDIILKAMDDAVRDGMDVLNLSIGGVDATRPKDDIMTRIVERISSMGVVFVVAAGNEGEAPFSISGTAIPPSAITVGASPNSRTLSAMVRFIDGSSFPAVSGSGVKPESPIAAPVFDVAGLDPSGLACDGFGAGALSGRIAFILRGTCLFEEKLNNVQAAGAVGAILYTHASDPDAFIMSVGGATLPAVMVSHTDGQEIKSKLAPFDSLPGSVDFHTVTDVDPNRVASFSSRGPNTDLGVKPDLLAVGSSLNSATLDGSYGLWEGTSFSAPIVTGAAAFLKGARPGLTVRHYRSMLINTADPLIVEGVGVAGVQQAGGGILNLDRALEATVAAYPTSVSFGDTTGALSRRLTISNLGTTADTYTISVQPFDGGPGPNASQTTVAVAPGSAQAIDMTLAPQGLAPGEYQGFILVKGSLPGSDIHVPYWYGISSPEPAHLTIVRSAESGFPLQLMPSAIDIRVTDSAGIPILSPPPTVTVVSGGGLVNSVRSMDATQPGLFRVNLWLGSAAGDNVFRVQAGSLSEDVTIPAE